MRDAAEPYARSPRLSCRRVAGLGDRS